MQEIDDLSIDLVKYPFNRDAFSAIEENIWVKNQWPLVYIIKNQTKKIAYVGESTNAFNRIKNHLSNKDRQVLNTITLIGSGMFNKSATLDIESQLIQYLSADTSLTLQNGNGGLTHHNYYDRELYKALFREIWDKLKSEQIVTKSLEEIENTNLFKYSPFKALSTEQHNSIIEILNKLIEGKTASIFVEGSAGTGKTILATYLMKLINSPLPAEDELEELEGFKLQEYNLLKKFQSKYGNAEIALVVPMTSLRKSLKSVFKSVGGLKPNMVIGPSDAIKKKYDILLIDESHRLARRKNIPNYGSFDSTNRALGLDDNGTQLDWILMNSKHQIFFYDPAQSVKPSDIPGEVFNKIKAKSDNPIKLHSQMRVSAGNDYISFVDKLLSCKPTSINNIPSKYDLKFFDSFKEFCNELMSKEKEHKLCRIIAGYSWPWISKNDKSNFDIEIEGYKFHWNINTSDWINNSDPATEIGCIHTTQGYDLNYAGIIFGHEITYNQSKNCIEIIPENYHDRNGSAGIHDVSRLKEYIINIYKTIMYRGIKGTYIYACDPNMRSYLKSIFNSNKIK